MNIKEDFLSKKAYRYYIFAAVIGFISYHLLITDYVTSPDGIIEGVSYFTNANWFLYGAGRWLYRYVSLLTGNIVSPLIIVLFNCVAITVSAFVIKKIWDVESDVFVYLSILVMLVSPTVIYLMTYTYSATGIGLAVFFCAVYCYGIFKLNPLKGSAVSVISIILLLGLDQGFVGTASSLVLFTLIIWLFKGKKVTDCLKKGVQALLTAFGGACLYLIVTKIALKVHRLDGSQDSQRLGGFSVEKIISSFGEKFVETYQTFIGYFSDDIFKRKYAYCLLLVIMAAVLAVGIYKLVKEKKIGNAVFTGLLIVLLPPVMNIIEIIVPYYEIYLPMEYQLTLIMPFTLYLVTETAGCLKPVKMVTVLLVVLVGWSYILSANATFRCYALSYEAINNEMSMVIDDVYHLDGYRKNETPIVIAGFPDDDVLADNLKIYRYAVDFPENPVFWEDMNGATINRQNYFLNYFGIDAKEISYDEYYSVLKTEEFKDMTIWPEKGSVQMIDGYAVVKFTNDPPMPY